MPTLGEVHLRDVVSDFIICIERGDGEVVCKPISNARDYLQIVSLLASNQGQRVREVVSGSVGSNRAGWSDETFRSFRVVDKCGPDQLFNYRLQVGRTQDCKRPIAGRLKLSVKRRHDLRCEILSGTHLRESLIYSGAPRWRDGTPAEMILA